MTLCGALLHTMPSLHGLLLTNPEASELPQLCTVEATYRSKALAAIGKMPDFWFDILGTQRSRRRWFRLLSSQLSLAVAQRALTFPEKIYAADNSRGLLRRVEAGWVFGLESSKIELRLA